MKEFIKEIIKEVHLTTKDISKLFKEEMGIPKYISYPFWYIYLFCKSIKEKGYKQLGELN